MCFTATKQTQKVKIRIVKDMNENPVKILKTIGTNEGDDLGIWQFELFYSEKLKMVLGHSPALKLSRYYCNT